MTAIHFFEMGKGRPVIFIHGFCEVAAMWNDIAKALSPDFHVICPDLPGFGNTPLHSETLTLEQVAITLKEWMEENKIQDPIVIGHSLGGYVTLALLDLMGDKIKGIGLIHSTSFADDEEKKESRDKTIAFIEKQGVEKFVTSFVPQLFTTSTRDLFQDEIELAVEQAKQSSKNGLIAFTKAMRNRESRYEILKNFKGPKLMISGTTDTAVKIEASRQQREAFTHYHELQGVGHMGHIERKEEVIGLLTRFLNH